MKLEKGCIHVYTGEGKGKTTAAFGVALRAARKGLGIFLIQFMKSGTEENTVKNIEGVDYKYFSASQGNKEWKWVQKDQVSEEDKKAAKEGLEFAKEIISKGGHDVVILDEIIMAIWFGLLSEEDVLSLLEKKPQHVELVLTGRKASEKLINAADYVSNIEKVKHPFDKGVLAREGIDY